MNIIITTSMSGTRYLHAVSLLHSLNLTTRPILSNMGNNPYARRAQLMGAHIQAMDYIIGNNEQWGRVFEDDIQLHDDFVRRPDLIDLFFNHRSSVYYGLCDPHVTRSHKYVGLCSHAYALRVNEAISFKKQLIQDLNVSGADRSLNRVVQKLGGLPLIGKDLYSPENSHHTGIFYQWRARFKGTIHIGPG